ncbi:GNAT family N-acetyltransferase [Rhodococcus sp. 077-4]|uniref:GNAT family N-acetyltransferase n=1 Tax=Rhodococcus sp. 077-4 TaxID=2789271 RepID=UPI0039F61201
MTMTSTPWHHPRPEQSRLHLDVVPSIVVHELASDRPSALAAQGISPYIAGIECRSLCRMRSKQIDDTPADAPWITRLMVDPDVMLPVGVAGFHGAPDERGMVEIGYRVDPELRRRGYARRSVETLLAVAQSRHEVTTVRATVAPGNAPSSTLVKSFGFVEMGEQWDDEDGLEIIYEISTSTPHRDQAVRIAPR